MEHNGDSIQLLLSEGAPTTFFLNMGAMSSLSFNASSQPYALQNTVWKSKEEERRAAAAVGGSLYTYILGGGGGTWGGWIGETAGTLGTLGTQ